MALRQISWAFLAICLGDRSMGAKCYLPGDGTTSHLATSFLDGLVSKQWIEATTVWSENGSSSLKFGSLSKISYDFDHRRSPAGQISWFWPSSLTLQFFFVLKNLIYWLF